MVTVENVSFNYKNKYQTVKAVRSVSAEFLRGKLYAIVGKSGSGKTTLISLLAGLELPLEGDIIYDGENLRRVNLALYRRNKASLIYQSFNLFPLLTALENVELPLKIKGISKAEIRKKAAAALESVGLDMPFHKRFPAMLSGGEQQRVAIARSLATEAELILADEPTGNLDSENGKTVISALLKLAHEYNRCVIIVTHDSQISDMADVVYQMADGAIKV